MEDENTIIELYKHKKNQYGYIKKLLHTYNTFKETPLHRHIDKYQFFQNTDGIWEIPKEVLQQYYMEKPEILIKRKKSATTSTNNTDKVRDKFSPEEQKQRNLRSYISRLNSLRVIPSLQTIQKHKLYKNDLNKWDSYLIQKNTNQNFNIKEYLQRINKKGITPYDITIQKYGLIKVNNKWCIPEQKMTEIEDHFKVKLKIKNIRNYLTRINNERRQPSLKYVESYHLFKQNDKWTFDETLLSDLLKNKYDSFYEISNETIQPPDGIINLPCETPDSVEEIIELPCETPETAEPNETTQLSYEVINENIEQPSNEMIINQQNIKSILYSLNKKGSTPSQKTIDKYALEKNDNGEWFSSLNIVNNNLYNAKILLNYINNNHKQPKKTTIDKYGFKKNIDTNQWYIPDEEMHRFVSKK